MEFEGEIQLPWEETSVHSHSFLFLPLGDFCPGVTFGSISSFPVCRGCHALHQQNGTQVWGGTRG